MSDKVYEIVTEKILEQLDQGVAPWVKPWDALPPHNAQTKRPYHGINHLLLNYVDGGPSFMTYNAAKKLGGTPQKGTGEKITFWKRTNYVKKFEDGTEEERNGFFLRYYIVFPVHTIKGLPEHYYKMGDNPFKPDLSIDAFINGLPLELGTSGRAFFCPSDDQVCVPKPEAFVSSEQYYKTVFHELIHWSGHASRLDRKGAMIPEEERGYGFEELVAEIGASYLCSIYELNDPVLVVEDTAAYCKIWAQHVRGMTSKAMVKASSKAQKAVDYLLDLAGEKGYNKEKEIANVNAA